jgi:hypothetical protein
MFGMMALWTVCCKCTRYDMYHHSYAVTTITVDSERWSA